MSSRMIHRKGGKHWIITCTVVLRFYLNWMIDSVTELIKNNVTPSNKEDFSATAIFDSKPVYIELLDSLNGFINLKMIYIVIIKLVNILKDLVKEIRFL